MQTDFRKKRIYVAGHRGLVGSALHAALTRHGCEQVFGFSSKECDLTEQEQVRALMQKVRPEIVVICAAKVGGILANSSYPADFIYRNLMIETNLLHEAYRSGVQKLFFLGSSCIYPRNCLQPMKESYLLQSALEPTNRPYALAKIAGIELCASYNRQYGTQFLALMPTNLYGPKDNYDLQDSHVIPAMIQKMHKAKIEGCQEVVLWGSGKPKREFLYSEDLADAILFLLGLAEKTYAALTRTCMQRFPLVNVGSGQELAIASLACSIADVVGYSGTITWDPAKPDGAPRKLLDCSLLHNLGWQARTCLLSGLKKTYEGYKESLMRHICCARVH